MIINNESHKSRGDIIEYVGTKRNIVLIMRNYKNIFPKIGDDINDIASSFYDVFKYNNVFGLDPEVQIQKNEDDGGIKNLTIFLIFHDQDPVLELSKLFQASTKACRMVSKIMRCNMVTTTTQLLSSNDF